jgi:hypothetical protein
VDRDERVKKGFASSNLDEPEMVCFFDGLDWFLDWLAGLGRDFAA